MVNQNVQDAIKKFWDTKDKEREKTQKQIMNSEELQQTSKWNKGHYKKRDIWIKDDNIKYKNINDKRVEQRYGKPQEKE
jgi:hypothetical protein